jgi:hypothetical protein
MIANNAEISSCGKYRWWLTRVFGLGSNSVAFIGLNPSTADASEDDPTIRRCVNFAKYWGFDRLVMLNLFAFRATDPKGLFNATDPVGEECDRFYKLGRECDLQIACWGNHGSYLNRDIAVRNQFPNLHCIKINKATGQPAHPLYLPGGSVPIPFL